MENSKCNFCGNKNNFVKYVMANNVITIREQCSECGNLSSLNFKRALFDLDKLNFMDLEKRQNYKQKRILISEQKKENPKYYNEVYLKSHEWKIKRKLILQRDNNVCRCCCGSASEVHHIDYHTVMKEDFNSLISVCRSCHEKIHFNGTVFFNELIANFGVLKYCHSCKKYHNDSSYFCNNCKEKI
jgi:hypothetical protein